MNVRFSRFNSVVLALALLASHRLTAGSFVLDVPSPSWPGACDILRDRPGPVAALPRPGILAPSLGLVAQDVIDALSDGRDPIDGEKHPGDTHLIFSVSRNSAGMPGTAVRQERVADTVPPGGAQPNGHASDLFVWDGVNGVNALAPPLLGWSLGSQTGDEANAHLLVPGGGQPGDDVNAYERATLRFVPVPGGPPFPQQPIFFSLRNGSPTLAAIGATGGDILAVGGAFGPNPVVYIPHPALALPAWVDLDALNLELHKNAAGVLVPWRLQFSVSSATLGFALPNGSVVNSGAHVLASAANGNSIIAHPAGQLGLLAADDVDALEIAVTEDGGVVVGPGPDGDNGVVIEFPPALGAGIKVATDDESKVRIQALTPHDESQVYLLPYIEQDNSLRRIGFGVTGRAEGWAGVGAEANARVNAWRNGEVVYEAKLDSMSEMGEMESLRLTRANGIIAILIGLLTTQPGHVEATFDLHTDGNSLVVMPDPGIVADRVVLTLSFRSTQEQALLRHHLSGLEITGKGIDRSDVSDLHVRRGILAGGRSHTALGDAIVGEGIEGDIDVLNLGSSGEDGVGVDLPRGSALRMGITPDQKAIIGGLVPEGFTARFGPGFASGDGSTDDKNDVAIEAVNGGLAVGFAVRGSKNGGEGGGGGLLSSPLGFFATRSLPAEIQLGQTGIEVAFDEEVSFVPAEGGAERRGKRVVLGNLWSSAAELTVVEVRTTAVSAFTVGLVADTAAPSFRRGDADQSGVVELTDAIATLGSLFLGSYEIECLDAADSNDDGAVSLADAINTLNMLFLGTTDIPAPGRLACGVDPTEDTLGCQAEKACR